MLVPLQAGMVTRYGQSFAFVRHRNRPEHRSTSLHGGVAAASLLLPGCVRALRTWTRRDRSCWRDSQYVVPVAPYGQQSIGISSQYSPIQRGFLLLVLVQPRNRLLPDDLSGHGGRLRPPAGL